MKFVSGSMRKLEVVKVEGVEGVKSEVLHSFSHRKIFEKKLNKIKSLIVRKVKSHSNKVLIKLNSLKVEWSESVKV